MKRRNIISSVIICIFFVFLFSSCSKSTSSGTPANTGGSTGGTGGAASNSVNIVSMSYSPTSITVKVGTAVKWTNTDGYSDHTVTSNDGASFNSGNISVGSSYTFTTSAAGTFPYHCTIHGAAMSGTLVVTP